MRLTRRSRTSVASTPRTAGFKALIAVLACGSAEIDREIDTLRLMLVETALEEGS